MLVRSPVLKSLRQAISSKFCGCLNHGPLGAFGWVSEASHKDLCFEVGFEAVCGQCSFLSSVDSGSGHMLAGLRCD